MKHLFLLLLLLFLGAPFCRAQDSLAKNIPQGTQQGPSRSSLSKEKMQKRKWLAGSVSALGYGGSLLLLNKAWYSQYEKAPFHTFNDSREWLQIDKAGHAWTAYHTSRAATELWKWSGLSPENATLVGSLSGFTYLTVIELLDAHSAKWGWSWPDMGANLFGSALFAGQELGWKEQRLTFKFSAHSRKYAPELEARTRSLYGTTLAESILKDYNTQTYWLSASLSSFFPNSRFPKWLNVAWGYGGDGIYGGFQNLVVDKEGRVLFDRRDIRRYRQWYLAPDIDLSRIPVKSKVLRTAFTVLNSLKFPAPSLEFSNGRVKGRWIHF